MMVEYKLTNKFTQEIIDELLRIEKQEGLTPENILDSARNEKNPLHDFFEWEDSVAAHKWRLAQARVLVNEVKVIVENNEYYAFENVAVSVPLSNTQSEAREPELLETKRVYKPVVEILSNEELRKQVVRAALAHLAYWEQQNAKYEELKPIIESAHQVREKLNKEWQKKKR